MNMTNFHDDGHDSTITIGLCTAYYGGAMVVFHKLYRRHRRHFFTTRVVNIWNFLPKDVVNFSTLCSFKNSLNSVDFSRFLMFS